MADADGRRSGRAAQTFDLAIGGITITDARRETMLMSDGYLANGKTILCRAAEADRYKSLADIDKSEVRVMVNPGGLNEKFANENLAHAVFDTQDRPALRLSRRERGRKTSWAAVYALTQTTSANWTALNAGSATGQTLGSAGATSYYYARRTSASPTRPRAAAA